MSNTIQPPPYGDAAGSFRWNEWYRIINQKLSQLSTSLGNIDDVTLTSIGDNDLLAYDSGSSTWINQTAAEAGLQTPGAVLDDLNTVGQVGADGEFLVGTGAGVFAWESGNVARTSLGLGTGDSPTFTGLTATGSGLSPILVESTNAGNGVGPTVTVRRTSASPADGDKGGVLDFTARLLGGATTTLGSIRAEFDGAANSATNGVSVLKFLTSRANSLRSRFEIEFTKHIFKSHNAEEVLTLVNDGTFANSATDATLRGGSNSSASDPVLHLWKDTGTPSTNDLFSSISFEQNTGAAVHNLLGTQILDATSGSEDTIFYFQTLVAGALATRLNIGAGLYSPSATGGDKGADTINVSSYYVDGTVGADFGPAAVTSITVVKGIVTAIS